MAVRVGEMKIDGSLTNQHGTNRFLLRKLGMNSSRRLGTNRFSLRKLGMRPFTMRRKVIMRKAI